LWLLIIIEKLWKDETPVPPDDEKPFNIVIRPRVELAEADSTMLTESKDKSNQAMGLVDTDRVPAGRLRRLADEESKLNKQLMSNHFHLV
jgi:hypothetical protein